MNMQYKGQLPKMVEMISNRQFPVMVKLLSNGQFPNIELFFYLLDNSPIVTCRARLSWDALHLEIAVVT